MVQVIKSNDGSLVDSERFYYAHSDHLNTPKHLTDDQRTVVWKWEGGAFGRGQETIDPNGDGKKRFSLRFPGQYYDVETDLNYNYYRDYDSKIGRYLQSDPIGLQGGLNTYAYVGGNPLSYIDPLGLFCGKGSHLYFDFRRGFRCELDPPPPNPNAKCVTIECVMRNGDGRDTRKNPTCPIVCRSASLPCQMLGSTISPQGAACRNTVGVVCKVICDEEETEECD